MAGRLLLVVLMCFFSETRAQALLPPKLAVNPAVITETDSVTLTCQTPSSVSVSQCHFNLGQKNMTAVSCRKTLTGTKLLKVSRSPAEVKIYCFYTVRVGDVNSSSPHSDTSSVTIHRQKPKMSRQHFQGEHVLFICTLPASADRNTTCNLYFGESSHLVQTKPQRKTSANQWFCQFTVTMDDFLRHLGSVQRHDASCDYTLRSEPSSLSPRSDGYNLTDIMKKESSTITTKPPFAVTTDVTVSSPASTFISPVTPSSDVTVSSPQSPVTPSSDMVEEETWTTQTVMTTFTMTTDLTVRTTHATATETPAEQTSGLTVSTPHVTTPESPAKQTSDQTLPVTPPSPAPETKLWKWKMWMLVIVVAGFGVIVGVTFVGVTLLCTKRRTERYSTFKRKEVNVTDDVVCMQSLDHGGLLPAGNDEHYSVITSVPGADCPAGSKKLDSQRSQNEDADIYHVYASISEESSPSALSVVYSTVQAH